MNRRECDLQASEQAPATRRTQTDAPEAPPYTAFWQLESGPHRFQARTEDEAGQVWLSRRVEITVKP